MFNAIADYASQYEEITIKSVQFQCLFVCFVINKSHHSPYKACPQATKHVSEFIVFIDSTSNLDQTQFSLTILLCASPIDELSLLGAHISVLNSTYKI